MECEQKCAVFGRCGGCSELNVPYDVQLSRKSNEICELFAGVCEAGAIKPILGMDEPLHYRNKVIAPFVPARSQRKKSTASGALHRRMAVGRKKGAGSTRGGADGAPAIRTGMYARGTHNVIEADSCLLENPLAKDVVSAVLAIMRKHGVEPYDEDAGTGFLRHAVVRIGHNSGEVLVTLVTNAEEFPYAKSFCRELVRRVPEVTTVVQSINMRSTNVILGGQERVLYGPGFILDTLCGLSFRISSHSFYQVNAVQTEVLYETAMQLAHLDDDGPAVLDAYCGTGTIGLVAASRGAKAVVGVDSVASSVRDARQNAKHNGISHAHFFVEDAETFMRKLAAGGLRACGGSNETARAFDGAQKVLFLDPPRAGSTSKFLEAASAMAPERIVYISCNPKTQLRDVTQLKDNGYKVEAVQPVDMFPHTPHIECIVSLRKGSLG